MINCERWKMFSLERRVRLKRAQCRGKAYKYWQQCASEFAMLG